MSLFHRAVATNAAVLVAATVLLAASPARVSSSLKPAEAVVLAVGVVVMIVVNLVFLRRVFGPLEQLTALMRRIDPRAPGRRLALVRADGEVAELAQAFNAMLDRLEDERRNSGRRALMAQEHERRRLARELHDEIAEAQETARAGVEDMREIARGLRPGALEDLGLRSALTTLAAQVTDRTGARVRPRIADDLPALAPEHDLAIYRIAQESLTNVARHARAVNVELALERTPAGEIELRVRDDGRGIAPQEAATGGSGLAGMRERALLVGGRISIAARQEGGTEVRLVVPAAAVPAGAAA